jgi:hypothetical protein
MLFLCFVLIGAMSLYGQGAYSVNWYVFALESGFDTHLFDSAGHEITDTTNLVFQLVADVQANTDFSAILSAGKNGAGWAIGSEHPVAADYGANDDIIIGSASWKPNRYIANFDANSVMKNAAGDPLYDVPFYFRWFNTDSESTATEAGFIYRENGDWVTGPEVVISPVDPIYAPLDFGFTNNLGSVKITETAGWQSTPRALLTAGGTDLRWFIDHEITLEPGDIWDDADHYDSDMNGVLNRFEYIAGTDPVNPDSVLKILHMDLIAAGTNRQVRITWAGARGGAPDTSWQMYSNTNSLSNPGWVPVPGIWTIPGTGTNTWDGELNLLDSPVFFHLEGSLP